MRGTDRILQRSICPIRFIPACAGNRRSSSSIRSTSSVHPRVCGEQSTAVRDVLEGAGSSPRVRGTAAKECGEEIHRRFIPACAGNSPGSHTPVGPSTVHPRVCGEQIPHFHDKHQFFGSSPRVRGTVAPRMQRAMPGRFIPACAGNSLYPRPRSPTEPVHPRVCGEQVCVSHFVSCKPGSSPRVRGTVPSQDSVPPRPRFIPACAGNRVWQSQRIETETVHPRVCGEQLNRQYKGPGRDGSSPRVRGTVNTGGHRQELRRFIPACAGNRVRKSDTCLSGAVHPRVCGEQGLRSRSDTLAHGSSPRVRGTAVKRGPVFFPGRFIPACAGNSSRDNSSTTAPPVHPRVCGEQVLEVDDFAIPAGSSPRVRGTGSPSSAGAGEGRFIPACAGNRGMIIPRDFQDTVHPRVCGEQDLRAL